MKADEQVTFRSRKPLFAENGSELPVIVLQELIWQNKIEKGFNTTDPLYEFAFLAGEYGELAQAIRDPEFEDLEEALVDIIVFSLSFFAMNEADAAPVIAEKINLVAKRNYKKSSRGYPQSEDWQYAETESAGTPPLGELQTKVLQLKQKQGFNLDPENQEEEFVLMGEELAELLDGIKSGSTRQILDSAADIIIYALGFLAIRKAAAYDLLTRKIVHNSTRKYKVDSPAVYIKLQT